MTSTSFPVDRVRARFPGLTRELGGRPAVFFDGPAGSQTPESVIEAVGGCLALANANLDGAFATSREAGEILAAAGRALCDFVGAGDPSEIVFGPNMTSLTFELSRALARTWSAGDEVVVTRLDHDANVTPWVLAAERAGATVRHVPIHTGDCTLDLDALRELVGERTRLVAIGAASNLVGTINPVAEIADIARGAGALTFVDAVHGAPHRLTDVEAQGCDFCACSAYKFFGPHIGILWGRGELLRALPVDKLRPVRDEIPYRFMHGTQNHEGIAGALAAVDYLADLGAELAGAELARRDRLRAAFRAIEAHEMALCDALLDGLAKIPGVRVHGIVDPSRRDERVPTVAFTHERRAPRAIAEHLGELGVFVWDGNNYALALTEALGLEPDGVVRIGILHYNTAAEVERLLGALRAFLA